MSDTYALFVMLMHTARLTTALILACLLGSPAFCSERQAASDCPIILVHGFGGWGPQELNGYRYWGGQNDIAAILREAGYTVHAATVSALASNWDRAVELYYQIKGGQVDYGAEHSTTYGHRQRPDGHFYDAPFYPEWDADHPIHLIGHSMGGQTIRMLAALLAGRSPRFQNVLRDTDNTTFTPGEGWVRSITTISTPHCGTALFDLLDNPLGTAALILQLAGITATDLLPAELYNFDLEQWDLAIADDEPLEVYLARVLTTLGDTMDFSIRELSTHGAERFNTLVNLETTDSRAYYFSFANEQTAPGPLGQCYYPKLTMNPFYVDSSLLIGTAPAFTDRIDSGARWRENDGVVNTASMCAPLSGCADTYALYRGTPFTGLWNFMGQYPMDHFDIIGHQQATPLQTRRLHQLYQRIAGVLNLIE